MSTSQRRNARETNRHVAVAGLGAAEVLEVRLRRLVAVEAALAAIRVRDDGRLAGRRDRAGHVDIPHELTGKARIRDAQDAAVAGGLPHDSRLALRTTVHGEEIRRLAAHTDAVPRDAEDAFDDV